MERLFQGEAGIPMATRSRQRETAQSQSASNPFIRATSPAQLTPALIGAFRQTDDSTFYSGMGSSPFVDRPINFLAGRTSTARSAGQRAHVAKQVGVDLDHLHPPLDQIVQEEVGHALDGNKPGDHPDDAFLKQVTFPWPYQHQYRQHEPGCTYQLKQQPASHGFLNQGQGHHWRNAHDRPKDAYPDAEQHGVRGSLRDSVSTATGMGGEAQPQTPPQLDSNSRPFVIFASEEMDYNPVCHGIARWLRTKE